MAYYINGNIYNTMCYIFIYYVTHYNIEEKGLRTSETWKGVNVVYTQECVKVDLGQWDRSMTLVAWLEGQGLSREDAIEIACCASKFGFCPYPDDEAS